MKNHKAIPVPNYNAHKQYKNKALTCYALEVKLHIPG